MASPSSPSTSSYPSPYIIHTSAVAGSPSSSASALKRKIALGRKRGDSDDEDEDMDHQLHGGNSSPVRQVRGLKKVRTEEGGNNKKLNNSSNHTSSSSTSSQPLLVVDKAKEVSTEDDDVDVGVLLALLPQSSLLPLLSSLVSQHPSLKSDIIKLMPPPSLPAALSALQAAELKVNNAIPFGWNGGRGAASIGSEYVAGRVKQPVEELCLLIQSQIPFFTSASQSLPPSETFQFLSHLTKAFLNISHLPLASLSSTLDSLWSRIANSYLAWLAGVSRLVNQEGGMISAGVVEGWCRDLDNFAALPIVQQQQQQPTTSFSVFGSMPIQQLPLVTAIEERIRREMGVVRDRWVGEVGWLINRRL